MKIQNISAKGKMVHIKINGYSYKKWLSGYGILDLPEVTRIDQLNLNAHEEAMIHVLEHTGIDPDPKPEFYFTVKSTQGATGGTTSLSGASVSILQGLNVSYSVYPHSDFYLTAYTVNGTAQSMLTPSATTVYTLTNIQQDKNIYVAFSRKGE